MNEGDRIAKAAETSKVHVDYMGDVNMVPYGGKFIIWSKESLHYGYFHVVEVIDLDSGCGFGGALCLTVASCPVVDKAKRRAAYDCCDAHDAPLVIQLESLHAYGYSDHDSDRTYQLDADSPVKFDGWIAERSTESDFIAEVELTVINEAESL